MSGNILLTGGAGYIGSHTALALLNAGFRVISFDNFTNSSQESLTRVERLTGKKIESIRGDILCKDSLRKVFSQYKIDAVIHFAGLKAVGESTKLPLRYYENNVAGTISLCNVMKEYGVKKLVFSSSATVYGNAEIIPIAESAQRVATNPYGQSKLINELILEDLSKSDSSWAITLLRYFNPVGAHESGVIGEDPNGIPNNLMPFISQVAVGKREALSIFGNDYSTHDGTGVRDYIHVMDLAEGHVKALQYLEMYTGIDAFNLGTGKGYSVLDVVSAFNEENHVDIPYVISARRPGDVAVCYADSSRAQALLDWRAQRNLLDMVRDAWRWQSQNPNGYNT